MGGETGGKLRHTILTGFNSEAIMSAVRALALICDACLWMLLRRIGSEAQHILDVLPKMWTESQEGSLNTYLEEETELGGEAGGKLRHTPSSPASTPSRSCRPCVPWR